MGRQELRGQVGRAALEGGHEREGRNAHPRNDCRSHFFFHGDFTVVAIGSQHPWEVGLISALRLWR